MTSAPRLELLKALGDNTRYAIYLEIARSSRPLGTSEIAETLDLHPNTVRPHLERMREVGLLDLQVDARGAVGRPQHRYRLAADAPSLGLEPPVFPLLAQLLATVADRAGVDANDCVEVGWMQGELSAAATPPAPCVEALTADLEAMGFDPAVGSDDDRTETVIAFTHCPFRELAEAHPELVCHLHRGLVEGFVAARGDGTVTEFHTVADRDPCQVTVVAEPAVA
jgi:predicted ArsR family transcriptional regulator